MLLCFRFGHSRAESFYKQAPRLLFISLPKSHSAFTFSLTGLVTVLTDSTC